MKEGWKYKRLGEIATYINGFAFKPSDWSIEGIPIIRIQNLTGTQLHFNKCSRKDIPEKYIVRNGDVLISWSATLGVFEWELGDAYLNQHIFKVVFEKEEINKKYFEYAISISINLMFQYTNGATMKHIRKGDFDNIRIPVPPLAEQQSIVSRLDSAFAKIDAVKANAEKQLNDAKALFQKELSKAMISKEGWEEKKLGEVTEVIHGKNQKDILSETGKYPIYGSGGNIMGYASDYLCEAGTTILGRKGSINNPMYIEEKFWNVDTAFGIGPKGNNVSKFIYYFVLSIDWNEKNTGTTLPSLTQQVVKNVKLSVPPLSEQQAIVTHLDTLSEKLKAVEEKQKAIMAECDAMKQALLRDVFE